MTKLTMSQPYKNAKSGTLSRFVGGIAAQLMPWWAGAIMAVVLTIVAPTVYVARELRRIGSRRT